MPCFTPLLRDKPDSSRSLRAANFQKARKSKQKKNQGDSHAEGNNDAGQDQQQAHQQASPRSTAQSSAASAAPKKAQLRVAGSLPDDANDVPPLSFPHAPASVSSAPPRPTAIQEQLASPPFRLYAVDPASADGAAHAQHDVSKRAHLENLSTLMHCCLLRGDYERAGRAWGMILRSRVDGGRPVDLRNHGHWGFGAEIAFQRRPQNAGVDVQGETPAGETGRFYPEAFELARAYYERLIIQYPYRRTMPNAVDERMIFPFKISLWIYEISEKAKRARSQLQSEYANRSRSRSVSSGGDATERPDDFGAREEATRVDELAQAMEIAADIDNVIRRPPFDKQANLLQLRGNVALWISDLTVGTSADEDWDAAVFAQASSENMAPIPDRLQRLINAKTVLHDAKGYFENAKANGAGDQASVLSSIDRRLTELTKYIEKLQHSQLDD